MIRSAGLSTARSSYPAFGEHVFDVVEKRPERLRDVPGIGPVGVREVGSV